MSTAAADPAAAVGVAGALLDAACRQARVIGADGVVAIADASVDASHRVEVVATAVREGGDARSAASDLDAAFGGDLRRLAVVYLGCAAPAADPAALEREMDAVAEIAGAVIAVEPEPAEGARWVQPDGRGARCRLRRGVDASLSPPPLRVAIADHQNKSAGLRDGLAAGGHRLTDDPSAADVVLIDHDAPFHGRLPMVEACVAAGGRAFLYPHGADPANKASWDGLYPISPLLSGSLVLADGHAEIARRYGYPFPVDVIGWPFCELAPRRRRAVRNVLFAPTHPPYLGNTRDRRRNAEIYRRLLDAPASVTVRHIGEIDENGLWEERGVTFVRGDLSDAPGQVAQIDRADAVVAHRATFGNLAVARGVTAVLWDSIEVWNNDASRQPDHLDAYRDLLRYPFDTDDGDMWELLQAAAEDEVRVAEWRERFIGAPVDADALSSALRGASGPARV